MERNGKRLTFSRFRRGNGEVKISDDESAHAPLIFRPEVQGPRRREIWQDFLPGGSPAVLCQYI